MQGMMMDRPLRIADILTFAEDTHGEAGVVSMAVEGGRHEQTYVEMGARCRKLARALQDLGVSVGDRIATLAWNGYRHMELYYAVPGVGAICHTLNPRLSAEQMIYITNHARNRVLFFDLTFLPIVEGLHSKFPKDMVCVVMTDAAHMPESNVPLLCYETLVDCQDGVFDWPDFDENTAAGLCYTSGTTGNPKGALYTHRSQVLHGMMAGLSMQQSMRMGRKMLPVVPLFHANSWGAAHAAPLTGVTLVMPGAKLDGPSVYDLIESEDVFSAWGVPTVWLGLLAEIKARGCPPKGLGEVVVGGSAAPTSMIAAFEEQGVNVCHAWGMTEMSPIGTLGHLSPKMTKRSDEEKLAMKSTQGRRIFMVDLKIVDENGARLPHDGEATGELYVRGPAIISGYYNNPDASAEAIDAEGWFGTGDVASINPDGFLTITDRAKDLIKSGGEWISSLDVENIAMSHPDIANCAVIAVAACDTPDQASILEHLSAHLAKWQLPDEVLFVDDLPLTATGKVSKLTLRKTYAGHKLAN